MKQTNIISGWGLLDGYQQGLGPAVHSFNKSDLNDLGKQFNDRFLSVFQHWRGWVVESNWAGTPLRRTGAAKNTFLYTVPVTCQMRPFCVFLRLVLSEKGLSTF